MSNEGLLDEPAYTVSFMHYEAFVIFLVTAGRVTGELEVRIRSS